MNGLLNKRLSEANNWVEVYQVPNTVEFQTATVSILNTGSDPATISLAYSTLSSPNLVDIIEEETKIAAKGTLLRTCELLAPGERVLLRADSNKVVIRVTGLGQPKAVA